MIKETNAVNAKKSYNTNFRISYGTVEIWDKTVELIEEALSTRRISTGPYVSEFEQKFAEIIGAKHAIAVSSGTDACAVMMASLLDTGAKRGDEVIVPSLTFAATANAVLMAGLTPVFVDVDPVSLTLDHDKVVQAITSKTRAIFPVHLMGKPAAMQELIEIVEEYDLQLFEDACQAHGSLYRNKRIGSFTVGASFSLYAAHLICTGEGGMITTNSDWHADLYRSIRSHGRPAGQLDFDFERVGFNSKMNELEAALGIAACDYYETIRQRRKNNYDILHQRISSLPRATEWFWFPVELPHETIGPQGFPLVVRENAPFSRQEIVNVLEKAQIEWKKLFGSLATQHRAYDFLQYKMGDFPVSEWVGQQGIHVGVHQDLIEEDLEYVVSTFKKFMAQY